MQLFWMPSYECDFNQIKKKGYSGSLFLILPYISITIF